MARGLRRKPRGLTEGQDSRHEQVCKTCESLRAQAVSKSEGLAMESFLSMIFYTTIRIIDVTIYQNNINQYLC